jgi:hypothetical protein
MAAESIIDARKQRGQVDECYLQSVSVIIIIKKKLIMAKTSRYKEEEWNIKDVVEGIRSLMMKAMFEDTFSM